MPVSTSSFGTARNGAEVTRFICTNANGYVLELIDYGATVIALSTPDAKGNFDNVVLGCNDIEGCETSTTYFGSTVGRVCNRIAGGKFSLGDKQFSLAANNGPHHLHGGLIGFDRTIWSGEPVSNSGSVGVRFCLTSKDGEEGYPGNLDVTAEYLLNDDNELVIQFHATTDAATHVNLTNHSYWNLAGAKSGSVLDHQLTIHADAYLPTDATSIPTGELASVEGTPFDFRAPYKIGDRMEAIKNDPNGYDHNFIVRDPDRGLRLATIVSDPKTGRTMEVSTTQPGMQLYTGNYLDGDSTSGGFDQHTGFCLETQGYPDAANQPDFPSTRLLPGETYQQKTVHRFSTR